MHDASSTTHKMPRVHLLGSTFWQDLPAHYTKINYRWNLIARLYHDVGAAIMATDRAAEWSSVKVELEMLEDDIKEFRAMVAAIEIEDVVGLYVVAGRQRWRAKQIAKEDLEDLENSVASIEGDFEEVKAHIVYGFKEKE